MGLWVEVGGVVSVREKGTTAEAERNKTEEREAKRDSLLKTSGSGRKKGRQKKRTKEEEGEERQLVA